MIRPVKRATNLHSITPNNIATQPILPAGSLLPLCLSLSQHRPLLSLLNTASRQYLCHRNTNTKHTHLHAFSLYVSHACAQTCPHPPVPRFTPNPPIHYICACLRVSQQQPAAFATEDKKLCPAIQDEAISLVERGETHWNFRREHLIVLLAYPQQARLIFLRHNVPARQVKHYSRNAGPYRNLRSACAYTLQWCYAMEVSFRQRKTRLKPDAWPPSRISRSPGQTPFGLK